GRLREIAFRRVGEGSGHKKDLDQYDQYYRHLILWDEEELEIAGAYRLAEAGKIDRHSDENLYSETLFKYDEKMQPY
ncbi:GNAT family N-acetyltransferase, partial [Neptuniibacter sp. UBA6509]